MARMLTACKPRLLDLFCGAGGAAMGYSRAGFDVVGVDIAPQPNYPFQVLEAEVFTWMGDRINREQLALIDAIHASPPCQHYAGATAWRGNRNDHPDLIATTRA